MGCAEGRSPHCRESEGVPQIKFPPFPAKKGIGGWPKVFFSILLGPPSALAWAG